MSKKIDNWQFNSDSSSWLASLNLAKESYQEK
jgi:hypothetical protein